jgi:hypothetical protein
VVLERRFEVERLPGITSGDALYAFRVPLSGREGRCFITAADAGQLSQLTTDWVGRALDNLRTAHGMTWLERCLCSDAGLQLHAEDASDPGSPPRRL